MTKVISCTVQTDEMRAQIASIRKELSEEVAVSPDRKLHSGVYCTFETRIKSERRKIVKKASQGTFRTIKLGSKPSSVPSCGSRTCPAERQPKGRHASAPGFPFCPPLPSLKTRTLRGDPKAEGQAPSTGQSPLKMLQALANTLRPKSERVSKAPQTPQEPAKRCRPSNSATAQALRSIEKFAESFLQRALP